MSNRLLDSFIKLIDAITHKLTYCTIWEYSIIKIDGYSPWAIDAIPVDPNCPFPSISQLTSKSIIANSQVKPKLGMSCFVTFADRNPKKPFILAFNSSNNSTDLIKYNPDEINIDASDSIKIGENTKYLIKIGENCDLVELGSGSELSIAPLSDTTGRVIRFADDVIIKIEEIPPNITPSAVTTNVNYTISLIGPKLLPLPSMVSKVKA